MDFLKHFIRACVYFSVLVKLLSGYLLFAANFEDIHTIAKKLTADKRPSVSTRNNPASPDSYYEYEEDYEKSYETRPKTDNEINKKRQKATSDTDADPQIDFEELVERVKKRIEKELKEKYLKNLKQEKENKSDVDDNETDTHKEKSDLEDKKETTQKKAKATEGEETSPDDTEFMDETTDKPQKIDSNKTQTQEEIRYEYADAIDDLTYKKIIMAKKDSYEDYKIPEKEDNIYSSSEKKERKKFENNHKRFKIEKNRQQKRHSNDSSESVSRQTKPSTKRVKSHGKLKSRTKTTPNDDYKDKTNSDEREGKTKKRDVDETSVTSAEITKRPKPGTMIPTRERFITVTPNYNANVPTLVEKYDFDEPLPERDRKREDRNYHGNPSAHPPLKQCG
ncbi:glutamic acid-rich protein-like [Vanessa cardui]|uniref:glutamic acid-rich protein-like n=1 Tax=Vanessa cardui TaxID=171605 RepID=UPI001F14258B|nr:glutamic acid-rich protein-like [Vanessa cardui]